MQFLAKTIGSMGLVAVLAVSQGCGSKTDSAAPATGEPASEAASAAPAPAAADPAEVEKAIRDLVVQTVEAAGKKDMNTYLRFYAPNAALVLPGMPITYGISAPRENGFPAGYAIKMDTAKVGVSQAGDLAYAFGTYEQTAPDAKTKKLADTVGKWMAVFAKQPDGSWGAVADTYNVDPPK
jgi:ketosteroid isomerase-like protein